MPVLHYSEVCLSVLPASVSVPAYGSICGKIHIYEFVRINKIHFQAGKG